MGHCRFCKSSDTHADNCPLVTREAVAIKAGYAPMDSVSSLERKKIVLRSETLRESIKQYFRDINHWNDSVRRSDEEPIDPDPDGKLTKMLRSLDDGLRRERVKRA